jgi:hypothetical protein
VWDSGRYGWGIRTDSVRTSPGSRGRALVKPSAKKKPSSTRVAVSDAPLAVLNDGSLAINLTHLDGMADLVKKIEKLVPSGRQRVGERSPLSAPGHVQ